MTMKIMKSTLDDTQSIMQLYQFAIQLQKEKNAVPWGEISKAQIKKEIQEGRQYKLMVNDEIASIWVYTYSDPEIWQEKNRDSAIYIHRIATNPKFRGQNRVGNLFAFTEKYAKENHYKLMRLDTAGWNQGLIKLYTNNGFRFLGTTKIKDTRNLPSHYKNVDVCLFERKIKRTFLERFLSKTISGAKDLSRFR